MKRSEAQITDDLGEPMDPEEAYTLLIAAVLASGGKIFIPDEYMDRELTGVFRTVPCDKGMTIIVDQVGQN